MRRSTSPAGGVVLERLGQLGVVPRAVGEQHVTVPVDLQHRARQVADGVDEHGEQRVGVHAGAQALHVQADAELAVARPTSSHPAHGGGAAHHVEGYDVGVRHHDRLAAPPGADLVGGALRQRDQRVGGRHQHVEVAVVRLAVEVVGVAQVVDGEDQRLAAPAERGDQLLEVRGAAGVEAEVEVEDVEVVGLDPGGVEHHRGPPLLRGGRARRRGVGQAHRTRAVLGREVTDVHVVGRHRGDDEAPGPRTRHGRRRARLRGHVGGGHAQKYPQVWCSCARACRRRADHLPWEEPRQAGSAPVSRTCSDTTPILVRRLRAAVRSALNAPTASSDSLAIR